MQEDISVLIIEDEEIWTRSIMLDLNKFGFKVVNAVASYDDAIKAIRADNYDVVLLDINLNGKNHGFELSKLIKTAQKKPFIFITGSIEHTTSIEAAAAYPSAYLTKPYSPASLFVSIQSAIYYAEAGKPAFDKRANNDLKFFFIKSNNKYKKISWQDVVCLRSEKNYTAIKTCTGEAFLIRSSLQKTLRDVIPATQLNNFLQVNRLEVLQISYIEEIIGHKAKTPNQLFTITGIYGKTLKERLNMMR